MVDVTAPHRITPRGAMQMARYGEPIDTYTWDLVVDRCLTHLAASGFMIVEADAQTPRSDGRPMPLTTRGHATPSAGPERGSSESACSARANCRNAVQTVIVTVNGWIHDTCWPCARRLVDWLDPAPQWPGEGQGGRCEE